MRLWKGLGLAARFDASVALPRAGAAGFSILLLVATLYLPNDRSRADNNAAPRYVALLIAINEYTHQDNLRTAIKDAERLKCSLERDYGFDCILINEKATKSRILDALRTLTLRKTDYLLVYYGGHGRERHWIPQDARDDPKGWISPWEIRSRLAKARSTTFVVSNSCYSGPLVRQLVAPPRRARGVAERNGALEAMASGESEVPDATSRGYSPFGLLLTRTLEENREPRLSAEALFTRMRKKAEGGEHESPEYVHASSARFEFRRLPEPEPPGEYPLEVREACLPHGWELPPGTVRLETGGDCPQATIKRIVEIDIVDGECRYTSVKDGAKMVLVRAGVFPYGEPPRETLVDGPFLIDKYETTNERFARYFAANDSTVAPKFWHRPHYERPGQPVVGVLMEHARRFAEWAGKLVPTEVQWEYAAAYAGVSEPHRDYPWHRTTFFDGGDAEAAFKTVQTPEDVGSYSRDVSWWKVCGMGSGVSEWCRMPSGEEEGGRGIVRGANQSTRDSLKRPTTWRMKPRTADYLANDLGFRCILPLVKTSPSAPK